MEQNEPHKNSSLGSFQYIRLIAKGGMGEVILAYDPFFKREVAIKKIRSDLKHQPPLKERFLREAKITATLTHPGVINIYSLHEDADEIYYVMPYIDGKTLKDILRKPNSLTIASFLPLFKSICQTIAYAHSKNIIHKDLKPENILVGNFGEVILLDWGLAQHISEKDEPLKDATNDEEKALTHRGKIVGTLAYMAPERALESKANFQTDIYALGVILYQMLTLRLPFQRTTVKEFRKNSNLETLIDPEEQAPYRDVPPRLSRIVKKCLETEAQKRYQTVEDLLTDLSAHMEGRSEWFESKKLSLQRKKDWEFKENILLSKHLAISRHIDSAEWVNIMISRAAFSEDVRVETQILLSEQATGVGFLLNAPESEEREHPLDGYCLWLGTDEEKSSQIFRNQSLAMHIPDLYLTRKKPYKILIEKNDNKIHVYIDGIHRLTYLSHLPLLGTHVGLLFRDLNFDMGELLVSVKTPSLQVSCLSIPDAFLSAKDYTRALAEYRRISNSFPGHTEAQVAHFRAGLTLMEQGKIAKSEKKTQDYYTQALEEFAKLHKTAGAPLEYLGKSLVYQALNEPKEEIKCLELALRRYQKHPLVHVIVEEILYRMQQSAQKDRHSAYELILLVLRHLRQKYSSSDSIRLFRHLINHWEPLYFLENPVDASLIGKEETAKERLSNEVAFAIPLAFWLANINAFAEFFQEVRQNNPDDDAALGNILYSLCELGDYKTAKEWFQQLSNPKALDDLLPIFHAHESGWEKSISSLQTLLENEEMQSRLWRTIIYLMQFALFQNEDEEKVHKLVEIISQIPWAVEEQILIDAYQIWAYLRQERYEEALKMFSKYSFELLNQETTLLHPLYGCYLRATENEEIALIHFSGVIDTPFPRSWALLGHELSNGILEKPSWMNTSFMWERRHLYRQLTLYYQCAENPKLETLYQDLEKEEYL